MRRCKHRKCPVSLSDIKRLLSHVRGSRSGCWHWRAATLGAGYGQTSIRSKQQLAHRVFYEIFIGPIPRGLVIHHLCGNRSCVNPRHLAAVTQSENVRDAAPRGASHYNSRKTHCKWGHPLTGDNVYMATDARGSKYRLCRACRLRIRRNYRAKLKRKQKSRR